jgi:Na+/H+ antiporter NhaD/arsenite permease-like protein
LSLTGGNGRRLILGLICLIAPICAFLPNATVVLLMAPVIIRVATALKIDFVPLLILTAIVSNASGLLTLVGDPATFIIGSAIYLSFVGYLARASLGGLLSILVILPLLPWLFGDIWRV